MKIIIDDKTTLENIQKEFEKTYKYLRLRFFKTPHSTNEGTSKKDLLSGDVLLSNLNFKKGEIEFNEDTTVNELEQLFKSNLGLNVQVFRQSGRSWIETTVTDNWSLKKQNEEGKELSQL
ncbi:MAG: hypothetical protein AB7O73_04865 [Bacteroidia bacterium]